MTSRELKTTDLDQVRSIHERCCDYPLPDLNHPLYLAKSVIEQNGKILGFGCLRLTSEAIVILDLDESTRSRALAIEELIRTGIYKCQKLGIDEMHAFLTGDNSFATVLKKRYGFEECQGIPLTLRL